MKQKKLTTSEKATEREPRSMLKAALYLLSTIVAIKLHESAPSSPDRTKYDLLRYPKSGRESLNSQTIIQKEIQQPKGTSQVS